MYNIGILMGSMGTVNNLITLYILMDVNWVIINRDIHEIIMGYSWDSHGLILINHD